MDALHCSFPSTLSGRDVWSKSASIAVMRRGLSERTMAQSITPLVAQVCFSGDLVSLIKQGGKTAPQSAEMGKGQREENGRESSGNRKIRVRVVGRIVAYNVNTAECIIEDPRESMQSAALQCQVLVKTELCGRFNWSPRCLVQFVGDAEMMDGGRDVSVAGDGKWMIQ